MWLIKIAVIMSFCAYLDSITDRNFSQDLVYRHVIEVSDISLENPILSPISSEDEQEMLARN